MANRIVVVEISYRGNYQQQNHCSVILHGQWHLCFKIIQKLLPTSLKVSSNCRGFCFVTSHHSYVKGECFGLSHNQLP